MAAVCCLLKWSNADLNAADLAYSRWVAVSKENIYIVRRKRKGDMRCSCCDMAEMRKTIPINNVQDIMITEPAAYAVCDCCVANVLTSIKVETAGNAGDGGINDPSVGLLMGMTDPQRFRTVVLNLKRGVYIRAALRRVHDGCGAARGGLARPDAWHARSARHRCLDRLLLLPGRR